MSKFVIVDKAPETLEDGEVVVNSPTFLEQIKKSNAKATGKKVTSLHHMRQILMLISNDVDPNLNAYATVPLSRFEGLPYETNEDLSNIVLKMLEKHSPATIDAAIEVQIKRRPAGTKTIYFVGGTPEKTNVFFKNGIAQGD